MIDFSKISLPELDQKFNKFLWDNKPSLDFTEKTFFDVSNYPHYEQVISNFYAFFLDKNEEHGFGDLFMISLIELLEEPLEIEVTSIETEITTNKGRIDLVIKEIDDNGVLKKIIIIENKIFISIYNDLNEYWSYFEEIEDDDKRGIILTLNKPLLNYKPYKIITHEEYLIRVFKNISSYYTNIKDKYLILLKDFANNLFNLTNKSRNMKPVLDYYFKNNEDIEDIVKLKDRVKTHIFGEFENAAQILGYKFTGSGAFRYREMMLNENSSLKLTLELGERDLTKLSLYLYFDKKKIKRSLSDFEKDNELADLISNLSPKNIFYEKYTWIYILDKEYSPNQTDFENYSEYILKTINNWRPLINYLNENII